MSTEHSKSPREVNGDKSLNLGYTAWLQALSSLPHLDFRTTNVWNGLSADLADEARLMAEQAQDHLGKLADLQLSMASKALSARQPSAFAEISSEWTAGTLGLASMQIQRRGEALSRMMNSLWPSAAKT